jgi:hypothetical protein
MCTLQNCVHIHIICVWFSMRPLHIISGEQLEVPLRLIHTYHAVPLPRPCRSPAMPCRLRLRLCLSNFIYTLRPCLIHTCHAWPMPCRAHAMQRPRRPEATSEGHSTTRHRCGMCEVVSAVLRRHVGDLPTFGFFKLPRGVPRRLLKEAYESVKV